MNRLLYNPKATRIKTLSAKRQIRATYTASQGTSIDSFFYKSFVYFFLSALSFLKSGCSDVPVYCMDEILEMSAFNPFKSSPKTAAKETRGEKSCCSQS